PSIMAMRRPTTPPSRPTSASTWPPASGAVRTITDTRPASGPLPSPAPAGRMAITTAGSRARATSRKVPGLRLPDAAVRIDSAPWSGGGRQSSCYVDRRDPWSPHEQPYAPGSQYIYVEQCLAGHATAWSVGGAGVLCTKVAHRASDQGRGFGGRGCGLG